MSHEVVEPTRNCPRMNRLPGRSRSCWPWAVGLFLVGISIPSAGAQGPDVVASDAADPQPEFVEVEQELIFDGGDFVDNLGEAIVVEAELGGVVEVEVAPPLEMLEVVEESVALTDEAVLELTGNAAPEEDPNAVKLLAMGADAWAYWDGAEDPGAEWATAGFDDTAWARGPAPLGYGDEHIKTSLQFGDDPSAKRLVAYFRRRITVPAELQPKLWIGSIVFDDAAAVFINGKEVQRFNLPEEPLDGSTRAVNAVSGEEETKVHQFQIGRELLQEGENLIAVRVHQTNETSSDLGFDFALRAATAAEIEAAQRKQVVDGGPRVLAAPAVAVRAAVVGRARRARSFIHLSDGEMTYFDENGIEHKQKSDAVTQARQYVRGVQFARVMEGDSLARLAMRHGISLDTLTLLNRNQAPQVATGNSLVCVSWTHDVAEGDTLQSLASLYNTDVKTLATLNQLAEDATLEPGAKLLVPGEYSYQAEEHGQSYLRLARYVQDVARQLPFDPQSQKVTREQLRDGEDLEAFAKRHQVEPDFLRRMNGLGEDDALATGDWLLVEYSVVLNKDATLADLEPYFGIELDKVLAMNDLTREEDLPADRRVQLPMGERMGVRNQGVVSANGGGPVVRRFVLGAAADDGRQPAASSGPQEALSE